MTLEYRAQRLWRAAQPDNPRAAGIYELRMKRAAYLRQRWLVEGRERMNAVGLYCVALCVRAMEREAR